MDPTPATQPRLRDRSRSSLPSYSPGVKPPLTSRPSRWFATFYLRLKAPLPVPPTVWAFIRTRLRRTRASVFLWVMLIALTWLVLGAKNLPFWPKEIIRYVHPTTLVFGREDLRRIWNWEITSGHYPSTIKIPDGVRYTYQPQNPGIPPSNSPRGPAFSLGSTIGVGSKRTYLTIEAPPPNAAYPPRVPTGAVADLDIIMDNCDFNKQKFVRDCLEVMRIGAGLDVGRRLRRGSVDMWKYIYTEDSSSKRPPITPPPRLSHKQKQRLKGADSNEGLRRQAELEPPLTNLSTPIPAKPFVDLPQPCDPDYPRIFHIFWAGTFTEKPYVALLSFLFTQNLGLHLERPDPAVCRPEVWMWINPGPAAAVPNPSALRDMFDSLKVNPWSAPFLHPRFKDVIKFKMWNTTEQLDGVPEMKDEWRKFEGNLFKSDGREYKARNEAKSAIKPSGADNHTAEEPPIPPKEKKKNDMFARSGSSSKSTYDQLSVILSDMARFILTHRFGGTYLDADTVFLRDWEELWGWKGAFAYRWSRLELFNTAVLKMNKGSALGTFLFKTALKNGLDFHPWWVHRYIKDAYLDGLLLRLPDALFDPAWLAQEGYQNERPPFPMFTDFYHFFNQPPQEGAPPQALGFEGFFKGAYSYHFHNFWWVPFDASRNFPDLGPKFKDGEKKARAQLRAEAAATAKKPKSGGKFAMKMKVVPDDPDIPLQDPWEHLTSEEVERLLKEEDDVLTHDKRDLAWSAVLKRTFEAYIRGERPNMYGEWLKW